MDGFLDLGLVDEALEVLSKSHGPVAGLQRVRALLMADQEGEAQRAWRSLGADRGAGDVDVGLQMAQLQDWLRNHAAVAKGWRSEVGVD